ncbi:MAG: 5-(carboxyamino)imidazole ribonucleotide synthase [Microscillaceae bacterium]|nr:5-(carboxyamino)imidazole ribonucleotide synthase [Microscillaceae bacterium]MDW8460391.1 5-(carboxyamino)imidazole ribonucleotide synthase [Cytophagales bacterium]
MNFYKQTSQKIAIVGGGQLGRMLLEAGSPLDLHFSVLDNSPDAPCASICRNFRVGKITDFQAVYNFGKEADVITIEIENVNTQALYELAKDGKKVFPQPHIISLIQDKILQKQFYQQNYIPTAEFRVAKNAREVQENSDFLPFVQKLAREGYDGRGVQIFHEVSQLAHAFDKPSVLEKLVPIDKEIAVIVCRNEQKEISIFPLVEMVFNPQYNLVDYIFSPAQVSPHIEQQAVEIARRIAQAFDLVGILAIEMFVDKQGNILVNEAAPRPHNSGHHTIEGCFTSQFEQHLRTILGLPFGSTALRSPWIGMLNLIGEIGYVGKPIYQNMEKILALQGAFVHLYGKKVTQPSRKMGHITFLAHSLEELIQKIRFARSEVKILAERAIPEKSAPWVS